MLETSITICVENHCTSTDKGDLLEDITASFLKAQQYCVTQKVRVTGSEVDVLAQNKITGQRIYVECKAWDEKLPGESISKLLGNVYLHSVESGWLVTTGGLTKDAEGIKYEWEQRAIEERSKLAFFTSDRVVETLISTSVVVDPKLLVSQLPDSFYFSGRCTLLITNFGYYWLFTLSTEQNSISTIIVAFEAMSGERVAGVETLRKLKSIKSPFSAYEWLPIEVSNAVKHLSSELESVTTVVSGDAWADYRPARPEDYVGRADLIRSVFNFFSDVQNSKTDLRLFSIKSPSGWGKSSTLVKLVREIAAHKKTRNYFLYAVDTRTAMSSRYAEFAFKSCLEEAIKDGFIDFDKSNVDLGEISSIASTNDVRKILQTLQKQNKVIVLVFDQFEEIFYKQELFELFENVRRLSNSIDSLRENFIIGFSWKTDFSVPSDHPAYYLWSNLQERRKEFDLLQFSDGEIKSALNVFSKVLGQKINPILTRYLTQQCQGYPWLLKKLCIHVYNTVNSGYRQEEAIKQTLNIGDLFNSELVALTSQETACVNYIAKESPADYFQVVDIFGQSTLQSLINHRTVIKRSTKLTLYWDIFRDFVNTGKLPDIAIDYMPQVQFFTFIKVLALLLQHVTPIDVNDIVKKLLLGRNTIDNILIDLSMIGLIDREKEGVCLKTLDQVKITKEIRDFFLRHTVFKMLQKQFNDSFSFEEYMTAFDSVYLSGSLSEKTRKIYAQRLLDWFVKTKIVIFTSNRYSLNLKVESFFLSDIFSSDSKLFITGYSRTRRAINKNPDLYWPQVSPSKVRSFYGDLSNGVVDSALLISKGHKKTIEDLISLNAIEIRNNEINLLLDEISLFSRVRNMKNISFAIDIYRVSPELSILQAGESIDAAYNKNWSSETKRTTGGTILRWAKELSNKENQ